MRSKYRQKIKDYLKLYLILETDILKLPLEKFVEEVLTAGVTAIQIRDKNKTINERYLTALKVINIAQNFNTLVVINDRIDLALALGIQNVHLGSKDLPIAVAREKFSDMIIGYSCNNIDDLSIAEKAQADYIGIGPVFFTKTKDDLRKVIHPEGIFELAEKTDIPSVAIGGISLENAHIFKNTKVAGIAISSAICASDNPKDVVLKFLDILYG